MLGYGSLWSVYWLFKLVTGKEGMGYGDFKLLAALGAWFGWQAVPLMILLSSFVGAALGIAILIAQRQGRDTPMPFGPYLAGAGLLTLFFGDTLITEYLQLVSP
jgi:leader peptidase (prepilin peptidase)/N-methyltransferase